MVFDPKYDSLIKKLELPEGGRLRLAIDTDAFNEADDQYALAYALLSPGRFDVEAVYAAPFHNENSSSPEDGMEKSYDEILEVLKLLRISPEGLAFRGSKGYIESPENPPASPAALDLIERAENGDGRPLYVATIGAPTNVAAALMLKPSIADKIVVVWLGGHSLRMPHTNEFNLNQDLIASRHLFSCGVPLIHMPCFGVTSHLITTFAELDFYMAGKNRLCDFLIKRLEGLYKGARPFGNGKVMWDVGTIAYLVNPSWFTRELVKAPDINNDMTWRLNAYDHPIMTMNYVKRNPVMADMFKKLASFKD